MRRLTAIVAVNPQGVIGRHNALPWRLKSDLSFFKEQTSGNTIIMGRKTYDSLGRCLPNRCNIVVSHRFGLFAQTDSCMPTQSIAEALFASENAPRKFKETFVIGGSTMYEQFSGLVDRFLITIVDKNVPDGDAFFPDSIIGDIENWNIETVFRSDIATNDDEAPFCVVELTAKDKAARQDRRQLLLESVRPNRNRVGDMRAAKTMSLPVTCLPLPL